MKTHLYIKLLSVLLIISISTMRAQVSMQYYKAGTTQESAYNNSLAFLGFMYASAVTAEKLNKKTKYNYDYKWSQKLPSGGMKYVTINYDFQENGLKTNFKSAYIIKNGVTTTVYPSTNPQSKKAYDSDVNLFIVNHAVWIDYTDINN